MSGTLSVWQWVVGVLFGEGDAPPDDSKHWWHDVISTSNAGLVSALLWERLSRLPELAAGMGADEREYLEALHELTQTRNAAILEQVWDAAGSLAAHGIATLPLKGAAYLVEDIGGARVRHASDIDLFVAGGAAGRAREILLGEGYRDAQVTLEEGHHHLIPIVHPDRPAAIELHTGVVPAFIGAALSETEVWSRSRAFRRGSVEVRVPHPTHAAALSFLHAELVDLNTARWYIPLREFCDLSMLQRAFGGEIDWSEIRQRAARVDGATRLGRYAYVYEKLAGERLLPDRRSSLLDVLSYRISVASIARPGIRRRLLRLSRRQLQRGYGTGDDRVAIGIARVRELTRMLGNAVGLGRDTR